MPWTDLVQKPAMGSINSGLTSPSNAFLTELFGKPRKSFTSDCQPIENTEYAKFIATVQIGNFRATGNKAFLDLVAQGFAEMYSKEPSLWNAMGSAGCLCCRLVRGSQTSISDHSWGTAIDFTISGQLDTRGDNLTQKGLARVYDFLYPKGIFWGAGFSTTEDAMHFALSKEKALEMALAGIWGANVKLRAQMID